MLKKHFLLLTLLAAIVFFWPQINYQGILSQEDHGRDLYTFAQIAQGKHIYKDMWWNYGPLMPTYYALFDLLFGLKISSVLLGKAVLNILGCLFFFMASCEVMSAAWAFLAACFFLPQQQDFFHTYNHTGGVTLLLVTLWLILRYLRTRELKYSYCALGVCLLIGFIKINFGVSALITTFLSIVIIETFSSSKNKQNLKSRLKPFFIGTLVVVPLLWLAVYFLLLNGLTVTEISQCLPYWGANKPLITNPLLSFNGYIINNWNTFLEDWISFLDSLILATQSPHKLINPQTLLTCSIALLKFLMYLLIYGSIAAAFGITISRKFKNKRREFWLTQSVLWLFIILSFHEFIVSNLWYCSFWSQPFILFFMFFMISTAASFAPPKFRYWVGGLCVSLFILVTGNKWQTTINACLPDKFLTSTNGQIYVGNKSDWVDTFNTVTDYLNKNLKKNELFLALPCDSLFYYLTSKPAPSRQTIFFNLIHVTPEQEFAVIRELEKNKVNYILLSNRIKAGSPELGEFGKTYCPLLFRYVAENFTPFYRYGGNPKAQPGWADNHGVVLLKRNQPLL